MQLHILVRGQVQGVGFREYARRSAERFEIRGYTMNLANRDVEIVAEGAKLALDKFIIALEKGPPASRVVCVRIDERDHSGEFTDFQIRY